MGAFGNISDVYAFCKWADSGVEIKLNYNNRSIIRDEERNTLLDVDIVKNKDGFNNWEGVTGTEASTNYRAWKKVNVGQTLTIHLE